jgi:hypothetical protein
MALETVAYKGNLQCLGRLRVKDLNSTKRLTNSESCFSRVFIQPIVRQVERIGDFRPRNIHDSFLLSYLLILLLIEQIGRDFRGIPNDVAEPFT